MKNRNKISIILIGFGLILILGGTIAKSLINTGPVLENNNNNNTNGGSVSPEEDTFGKLPIPVLLEDENPEEGVSDFTLDATEGFTDFYENSITPTMGYNGTFLGPVIKVKKGDQVNMHVNNELSDATSVHWHGLEVEGSKDGGPHQMIKVGETWNPSFTIEQPAATLWFTLMLWAPQPLKFILV